MMHHRLAAAGLCLGALATLGFAPAGTVASRAGRAAPARKLAAGGPAAAAVRCPYGMVGVPGGTFRMGDDETPEKAGDVTVEAFCADLTEVTSAAYAACVEAGTCTAADAWSDSNDCNAGRPGAERHPINCVDWHQAKVYCEAQGKRLPTEEEWEFAARGVDGRLYPWGEAEPEAQLCWARTSDGATCPVSAFTAGRSPFGLTDMAGNVREWTATGATDADGDRVTRGGGWMDADSSYVRAASRFMDEAASRDALVGFRCVGAPEG